VGNNRRSSIVMTDDEVATFLEQSRTATLVSNGPNGVPHVVAMWYGLIDGRLYFETKAKSQKAQNLRRDNTIVCMVEAGHSYDQLRGVSVEGTATILEDTDDVFGAAGVTHYERYTGPYTEEKRPILELTMKKRVAIRIDPTRVRSWDHRKLGMAAMDVAGSTAAYL